ncbi:MAG: extracellular solute-binding protein [Acidimicrobiales bacterium]
MTRRRRLDRAIALSATGLLAVGLVAGCSGDDRLTVYSGRTQDLIGPLLERFSGETGIRIDVRYGDSGELAQLIDTEGDNSPADVFISQSPGAVAFLDQADRLRTLDEDLVEAVPADDRADDGHWVGLTARVRVLVYNTEQVDPAELPRSVFDLTDPRYRGQVGVAPPNASFQDFVTAMRLDAGDDETLGWLEDMAANEARTYPNNVSIVEAVGRGEIRFGLVNHYYNDQAKAENPSVPSENYFFPGGDLGSLLLVTAASLVETTDQTEDGERLVEFLLSAESQEYFAEETKEYPLAAEATPRGSLATLADLDVARVSFDELGDLARTEELIDESGIEG